jgi:type 2 lantibiotic biosynthesis protein LanM
MLHGHSSRPTRRKSKPVSGGAAEHGVIAEHERQRIQSRLTRHLYTLVFGATSRVMVVEMAAAESTGLLPGETPEERYDFFASMLRDPSFCVQVLNQYPVLWEQLVALCRNWKNANLELVARLRADWELIQKTFFHESPAGKVVDLEISAGDVHWRGRSTSIVRFADGSRLVYKPRPLAVDVHFRTFAEWINHKLDKPQVLVPQTVHRGDYGWSAFITHEPVADAGELARYYERLGAVLALAYVTGLSDLHADNVIAHRAWPVVVDLETLLRPMVKNDPVGGAARESNRILDQSVLATQLLAIRAISPDENERLVDMGGIADLADQMTPIRVPIWRNLGRVDARLDHAHQHFGPAGNMPVLNGARVPADLYSETITSGFAEVYLLLQANKTELKRRQGPLVAFAEDYTRVVLRGTSNYAQLLSASFHPDYLRDSRKKEALFAGYLSDTESKEPDRQDLVSAEISDLWQCDIPCFAARAGRRELISSQGETLKLRLAASGLDLAFRRLDDLNDADLARQCWLIKVMLAKGDGHAEREALPLANVTGCFDLQEAARIIAHTAR